MKERQTGSKGEKPEGFAKRGRSHTKKIPEKNATGVGKEGRGGHRKRPPLLAGAEKRKDPRRDRRKINPKRQGEVGGKKNKRP